MPHHTKDKGDIGVLKAHADLAVQGFMVLQPLTEHAPFDTVAYKDNCFIRISVKYRRLTNGNIHVPFASVWSDKHGIHRQLIDKTAIDVICIYCPDTDACYYVRPAEFNKSITLRVKPPKNNQKLHVNFADDYRRVP